MANQSQLDVLKQGVSVWNTWRKLNPGVKPDLSGADFTGRNLSHANFSNANLVGCNFTDVDLTGADLSGANLGQTTGLTWQG